MSPPRRLIPFLDDIENAPSKKPVPAAVLAGEDSKALPSGPSGPGDGGPEDGGPEAADSLTS